MKITVEFDDAEVPLINTAVIKEETKDAIDVGRCLLKVVFAYEPFRSEKAVYGMIDESIQITGFDPFELLKRFDDSLLKQFSNCIKRVSSLRKTQNGTSSSAPGSADDSDPDSAGG